MEENRKETIRKESEILFKNWNKIDKVLGGAAILILILTMIYSSLNR